MVSNPTAMAVPWQRLTQTRDDEAQNDGHSVCGREFGLAMTTELTDAKIYGVGTVAIALWMQPDQTI